MSNPRPFYISEHDPTAKREILRAAMKLFSLHGLAGTSIRDIARESRFTNPALYKHFASKEELALYLFEACHAKVWASCAAALASADDFSGKLNAYVRAWLALRDADPEVLAFLSDSARVLWPKACDSVRRNAMIGLARSLVAESPLARRGASQDELDLAAATLQGTLAELFRMIHVGAVDGPAQRWQNGLVALFEQSLT